MSEQELQFIERVINSRDPPHPWNTWLVDTIRSLMAQLRLERKQKNCYTAK